MSDLDPAELRRLAEAGTPGPWEARGATFDTTAANAKRFYGSSSLEAGLKQGVANAALIVAAVNSLPELISCAERLERLSAMAECGTAESFLALPDGEKRLFFALAVDDSDRRKRCEVALRTLKDMLTIPAAEYVPAIPDCWRVIDHALGETARG